MRITETGKKVVPFKQVLTGQVFKAGQEYYIKIVSNPELAANFNAVNLGDGKVAIFSVEAETIAVESVLTVTESR